MNFIRQDGRKNLRIINMAFVPPKRIRDLVLKSSKGEITPKEEQELSQLCKSSVKSSTSDYTPLGALLFAGWIGGMFN